MTMNRIFQVSRRAGATLLLAASLFRGGANVATAANFEPQVRIVSKLQTVNVDGLQFNYEARIAFCDDHRPAPGSFVSFTSPDGDTLRLVPVWGTVDRQTHGIVLTFTPIIDRQTGPEDLVVAVVQQSTADPGCVIWDYIDDVVVASPPPAFDATGSISLSRRGVACAPVDYGQLDVWAAIDTQLQRVEPLPPSNIVGFEAQIRLDREQAARGFLDIHLPGATVSYEPIYGAMFPGIEGAAPRGFVISLRADRQAPLTINDHVLRASVMPDGSPTNPECLIWDLTNGESGRVDGLFDALGSIRLFSPRTATGIAAQRLKNR